MVKVRDFFDPFPEPKIVKSNKLFAEYLGQKYGTDSELFMKLVGQFKKRYYGKYNQSKPRFFEREKEFLDRDVLFVKAKKTIKKAMKAVRKPFAALSERQKKRRSDEFLRENPDVFEYTAKKKYKPAIDLLEKEGLNAAGVKSANESLVQLAVLGNIHIILVKHLFSQ